MHATQARRFTATLVEVPMKIDEATLKNLFSFMFQPLEVFFCEDFCNG
jgi:hypothetical protein